MCRIKRDVRYTVMILLVICQLMCTTVPGAHIRFMNSVLSLKWRVTSIEAHVWNKDVQATIDTSSLKFPDFKLAIKDP
jgi:hypothetical protein